MRYSTQAKGQSIRTVPSDYDALVPDYPGLAETYSAAAEDNTVAEAAKLGQTIKRAVLGGPKS